VIITSTPGPMPVYFLPGFPDIDLWLLLSQGTGLMTFRCQVVQNVFSVSKLKQRRIQVEEVPVSQHQQSLPSKFSAAFIKNINLYCLYSRHKNLSLSLVYTENCISDVGQQLHLKFSQWSNGQNIILFVWTGLEVKSLTVCEAQVMTMALKMV
jgi:hypothetical protein